MQPSSDAHEEHGEEDGQLRAMAVLAVVSGLLVVLGSLGPWADVNAILRGGRVLHFTIRGMDTGPGVTTFACGWVAVASMVARVAPPRAGRWMGLATLVLFATSLIIAIVSLNDVGGLTDDGTEGLSRVVNPRWGLAMVALAALLGGAGAAALAVRDYWEVITRAGRLRAPRISGRGLAIAATPDGGFYPAAGVLFATALAAIGNLAPRAVFSLTVRNVRFDDTIYGLETNGGRTGLVLALLAGGCAAIRLLRPHRSSWTLWTAFILLSLSATVSALNWADVEGLVTEEGRLLNRLASPGWGVELATLAALAGAACAIWGIITGMLAPKPLPPPPPAPPALDTQSRER